MAHTPTHNTSASQNLNYQQDLISGFGNLPLAYVQGAIPLSTLAAYVRDAAYEPIIMPNFEAQEAQIVGNIETALADKPELLEEALYLLAEVSAGTLSPEAAQQRFAIAEGSAALGQQSPTAQLVSVLLSDAQNLADSVRQFTTDNDIVELDGQAYKRRSADERNKLLRDYGLDNVLSDPELYGFEKRDRELSGVDRFIQNFASQEAEAKAQGGEAAKRLAEAESVMAAYLREKADRAPSRAATGARRSVQNAGVADRAGIKAGRAVDTTVYDEKFQENLLAEAMNRNAAVAPYAQGAELVPSPGVMGAGGSVPLSTSDRPVSTPEAPVRSRTVTKPPPYTDADLRRLRDEARDAENRQKMAAAQRKQQELIYKGLANSSQRYMAPASQLLNEGLAQMGAAVAPAPRVSKPKIKLDSETISRIVNGI